jgi:hypothetical protein
MFLTKQTALSQHFGAKMNFRPSKAGYEAGIVVWWSMYSYASSGVTRSAVDVHCVRYFEVHHTKKKLFEYVIFLCFRDDKLSLVAEADIAKPISI